MRFADAVRILGAGTVLGSLAGLGSWSWASEPTLDPAWVGGFTWRSIGPANMSGRIVDLDVHPSDHSLWFVSTASGGLLKSTNAGATFEHLFQDQPTVSIGATAVAASDPNIVWVGTGENNPRNSSSWGDGVYKSTDGGKTWTHKGLRGTFTTGDILIHPNDPSVVYVGAMGRTWGENAERGLYRTKDGGETWEKILYIDERTGVIDLSMNPENPDVMLCAMWERQRDEFDTNDPAKRWGEGAGLYRTIDGGATWERVTQGLPSAKLGRLGMDWSRSEKDTVYMLVDSERIGGGGAEKPGFMGVSGQDADAGARLTSVTDDGPAAKAGLKVGDIIVELDGERISSYDEFSWRIRLKSEADVVKVVVVRDREEMEFEVTLETHPNPQGKPFTSDLDGQMPNVHDRQGADGHETGGLFRSTDAGKSWTRVNSINPRPMYFSKLAIDPSDPNFQWVGGVQLMKSEDGGKTFSRDGGPGVHADGHAFWIDPNDGRHILHGTDGGLYESHDRGKSWYHHNQMAIGQFYHVAADTRPRYNVYGGLQDNGSWGGPSRTRTPGGPDNTDWFRIGGGDGFICAVDPEDPDQLYMASQNGGIARYNVRTGERASVRPRPEQGSSLEYRFNWKTPFALSHHNSKIYYAAGNYVFRSIKKGDEMERISPEITRTKRGTATAFSESPRDSDVLYVGTDDGALWVTQDGGREWTNIIFPREADAAAEGEVKPEAQGEGEPAQEAPPQAPTPQEAPTPRDVPTQAPPRAGDQPQGDRLAGMFDRLDQNNDGKLMGDEIPERMRMLVGGADTNSDGAISREEMQAAMGRFAGAQGGRQRGGQAGGQADEQRGERRPRAEPERARQAPREQATTPLDPIAGVWNVRTVSDQGETETTLTITRAVDGALSARIANEFLDQSTDRVTFNAETGDLTFSITTDFGAAQGTGKVSGNSISGELVFGQGQFRASFSGSRRVETQDNSTDDAITLDDLIPAPGRFSALEASRFESGRVYATIDRHYYDDTKPYVVVSEDFGKTWASIANTLPDGSARVIREDMHNPDLLYLGTEFGLFVSIDRGSTWTRFHNNLPTVAVHDVAQHALSGEIIAATHGRSLWITDVSALRAMREDVLDAPAYLLPPAPVIRWHALPGGGDQGGVSFYQGQNPSSDARIYFALGQNRRASIRILDVEGRLVRDLGTPETKQGLNWVDWDLRRDVPQGGPSGPQGGPAGAGQGRFRRGPIVPVGFYRVVLESGEIRMEQRLEVRADPDYTP